MTKNACGHDAASAPSRICPHLLADEDLPYVAVLTGHGVEHDLCCEECYPPAELVTACVECFEEVTGEFQGMTAWRGEPEVRERPEPVGTTPHRVALPAEVAGAVDLAPLPDGRWLLLLDAPYRVVAFDPATGLTGEPVDVALAAEEHRNTHWGPPKPVLHTSPDGRFAVVAHDHGVTGAVVDLTTGKTTRQVDRGDYHSDTTPYPVAFVRLDGRQVLCHGTGWCSLGFSDPATGATVVEREPTGRLFNGRLSVSPSGHRVVSDGWFWTPLGSPNTWDMRDPDSGTPLCWRAYYWNEGVCWVGDDLLAVGGIGVDDQVMLDGVRIFDAASGAEVAVFAGPKRGRYFAEGPRLYAVTGEGVEIWDHTTGERTGAVPGFVPTAQRAGALAALVDGAVVTWATTGDA
ncbi:hypothetical protein [Umezawaea sp. Da 62-37]|uniref:YncE family protein n=1 Tax=Umezawaea sp. Da 62-37 TaxID=3075927 RepID=UPI0028F74B5C|nr:hypothetical protein [Umezawaea sp. Da 62-37]WNV84225.1 hypothetical protein RM788_39615 [Umezawaea sp. Da 62-37]